MIINSENLLLGRLAAIVAKKLLLGESVIVVNCGKAMISGKKREVIEKFKARTKRGSVRKGPFISRSPAMLVKRTVRGMLPYKKERGRSALSNLRCYDDVPKSINEEPKTMDFVNVSKLPNIKFISMDELSRELGGNK